MNPGSIRFYLFGSFRFETQIKTQPLPTRKAQALLAYLVLFPQGHAREKLAALFWGDSTDAQARVSLRAALAAIRKSFGPDFLTADHQVAQLNPNRLPWSDVSAFTSLVTTPMRAEPTSLEKALSLYQGDLLADWYDDWILEARREYRTLFLDILLRLAHEFRACGEYDRALQFARKVLTYDLPNERAYQQIMFCLAALGNRASALKQYDECVQVLRRELDVGPSTETEALVRWIRRTSPVTASLEAQPTNLPSPATRFIGREWELNHVKSLLSGTSGTPAEPRSARLVTLAGAGGCGKTRLAIEVGHELVRGQAFPDGVWWVDLSMYSDPSVLAHAICKSLGLRERGEEPLNQTIREYLRAKKLLLVLDNCEHLVSACSQLVEDLLSTCPTLKILATSRQVLNVTGETTHHVNPLTLPMPDQPGSNVEALMAALPRYDALRLYIERAEAVRPGWRLTPENARAVAELCRRLDGIPLALEIAAAWVRVLSVEQIAARLDDRLDLSIAGGHTVRPRHQTLRATLDWSYDLLDDAERVLFRRLAVFTGGWTLEAAEAVCSSEGVAQGGSRKKGKLLERRRVLELLAHLVDKSLVIVEPEGSEVRYRLLETVKEYARDKLGESGELAATRRRHAEYFLELARTGECELEGPRQVVWLARLDRAHDNLRAALEWALSHKQSELALRLSASLGLFWFLHPYSDAGRHYIEAALEMARNAPPELCAYALLRLGRLEVEQGDYARARTSYLKSRKLWRQLGKRWGLARATSRLGQLDSLQGEYPQAQEQLEESLSLWRELGDSHGLAHTLFYLGITVLIQSDFANAKRCLEESLELAQALSLEGLRALVLNGLGEVARAEGQTGRAARYYEASMALSHKLGHKRNLAHLTSNLGYVAHSQGDDARALSLFRESLVLCQECKTKRAVAEPLAGLAGVLVQKGQLRTAAQLAGAASSLHATLGNVWWPADRTTLDETIAKVRQGLDAAAFDAAWQAGEKLTFEEAIVCALHAG